MAWAIVLITPDTLAELGFVFVVPAMLLAALVGLRIFGLAAFVLTHRLHRAQARPDHPAGRITPEAPQAIIR